MWTDVVDLRDFYYSGLGQVARRLIRRHIRELWPDLSGQRLLGIGFAPPYLRQYVDEAERVIAVMPASQGVLPWPSDGPGLTALAVESELPLPDRSVDRIIMIHALESTENVRTMMREAWRVLSDGGRLLVIVPNRRGIWARLERTPFGNGRPYTPGQMSRLLRDNMFTPLHSQAALFVPPVRSRLVLSSANALERLGQRWFQTFAGVLLVEASKQIYGATPLKREPVKRGAYIPLPSGFRRDVF